MPYVKGTNTATAIVAENPGSAPNTIPIAKPARQIRRFIGVKTLVKPINIFSITKIPPNYRFSEIQLPLGRITDSKRLNT